jgi:hypothetical protein
MRIMETPSQLCKYRSLRDEAGQHTRDLLTKCEIYFAQQSQFDDPFDCALHVNATTDPRTRAVRIRELHPDASPTEIDQLVADASSPRREREMEESVRKTMGETLDKCGIFCLCERPDDIRIWSHYADGHRGICLEFGLQDGRLFGCDLLRVRYDKRYPNLSLYDVCDEEWTKRYLTIKANAWKHEREWRILYRAPGTQQYPADELSGVILGARMPCARREEVLRWISEAPVHPKVFQAQLKTTSFGVKIIPLKDVAA